MARLLIWCLVWMQVHLSKRAAVGSIFGAMGSKARKWLSRRDVPTSRRPHVATSQRHDVGSKMQKSTIRNVVTFQRRDVSTSRRQHGICTSSFKARMVRNARHREAYELGHGIPEQSDANFEEVTVICTVSHFWILE